MIYFFEKEKNEKNEKMDDTGSHIVVAPDKKKLKTKNKLHIFGLKNTNNKKKSDVIFRHPLKNEYKKIKKLMKSRIFLFFCINFLRGVGI